MWRRGKSKNGTANRDLDLDLNRVSTIVTLNR